MESIVRNVISLGNFSLAVEAFCNQNMQFYRHTVMDKTEILLHLVKIQSHRMHPHHQRTILNLEH